jgi:hypothetical protein
MCHKCRNIIEQLLKQEQKPNDTLMKNMLWQRGYLTGMLQTIIHDDVHLRKTLIKKIKQ